MVVTSRTLARMTRAAPLTTVVEVAATAGTAASSVTQSLAAAGGRGRCDSAVTAVFASLPQQMQSAVALVGRCPPPVLRQVSTASATLTADGSAAWRHRRGGEVGAPAAAAGPPRRVRILAFPRRGSPRVGMSPSDAHPSRRRL